MRNALSSLFLPVFVFATTSCAASLWITAATIVPVAAAFPSPRAPLLHSSSTNLCRRRRRLLHHRNIMTDRFDATAPQARALAAAGAKATEKEDANNEKSTATDLSATSVVGNNDKKQDDPIQAALRFCRMAGRLKSTPRTGWVRRGVPGYESVADHSWRVAVLSLLLPQHQQDDQSQPQPASSSDSMDLFKCLALGVVHDLAEAVVGDICPDDHVAKQDKERMEHEAMQTMSDLLTRARRPVGDDKTTATAKDATAETTTTTIPTTLLQSLFAEYEARQTPEAVAVKDLDLLDMILQADEYEQTFGMDLSEFFQGTPARRFQTSFIRQLAQQVHTERDARLAAAAAATQQDDDDDGGVAAGLSKEDAAFVDEYAKASCLDAASIEQVVHSLRQWESRAL